jgi:hypothetical protein
LAWPPVEMTLRRPSATSILRARNMSTGAKDISDASRIVVSSDQVWCGLGEEAAIVNLKNGVYYGLDPVGARIWSALREPVTFAQLRDALLSEYEVEPLALEGDIRSFLQQLAEQGLVEIGV